MHAQTNGVRNGNGMGLVGSPVSKVLKMKKKIRKNFKQNDAV